MKKVLLIILGVIIFGWVGLRLFMLYSSNNILSNEAAFEIYLDIPEDQLDGFFGVEAGTINLQEDLIICKLPVTTEGFHSGYVPVKFNKENINCSEEYTEGVHTKYESYELKGTVSALLVLRDYNQPLMLFSEQMDSRYIIGRKHLNLHYNKGEINRLIIRKNQILNFCNLKFSTQQKFIDYWLSE